MVNIRRGEYSPIFTDTEANNCFSIITQVIISENKNRPKIVCLFQIVTRQWKETDSLPITCSIEVICAIDKLHVPQAKCQYS